MDVINKDTVWSGNIINSSGTIDAPGGLIDNTLIVSGAVVNVPSGGIANSNVIGNSGTLNLSNAQGDSNIVSNGGILNIHYATVSNTTVNAGGLLNAGSGDDDTYSRVNVAISTTINSGGVFNISRGYTAENIVNGGTVNVYSSGSLYNTQVSNGLVNILENTGYVSNVVIYSGASLNMSAGVAQGNTILSGGLLNIYSGGMAQNNTLSSGGIFTIYSGASAVNNTLNSGAVFIVKEGAYISGNDINGGVVEAPGGYVDNTLITSHAVVNLGSGGIGQGNTIESGGILNIHYATVSNTTVNAGGLLNAGSGDDDTYSRVNVAISTTINSGGVFNISRGYTAENIVNGGTVNVYSSGSLYNTQVSNGLVNILENTGYVSNVVIYSGASLNMSAGVAQGNTILSGGLLNIYSGGMAQNNTLSSGGIFTIYSGASAVNNTLNSGAVFIVKEGAYISGNDINGGVVEAPGGYVDNTLITSHAVVNLGSGGIGQGNTIESGGILNIHYATVSNTTVNAGGLLNAGSGDGDTYSRVNVAISTTINSGGVFNISRGYTAENIVNGGTVNVYSSGSLYNTQVSNGLVNILENTGYVGNVVIYSGASLNMSAGVAQGNTILSGGLLNIYSGGMAQNNTLSNGGVANIYNEGVFASGTLRDNALLQVHSGGSVTNNKIYAGGIIIVDDSGVAVSNQIGSGATLTVNAGGSAVGNTLYNGASFTVNSGGLITDGTVTDGGVLLIQSGGKLKDISVQSGGSAIISQGGELTGTITLDKGGYLAIMTSTGGTVHFTDTTTPLYLIRTFQEAALTTAQSGLVISGTGNVTTVISGFSGTSANDSDKITLANVEQDEVTQVTYPDDDHVQFDLKDGSNIKLNVIGVKSQGYSLSSDANGALVYEVCFLTGTLITMAQGVTAVEDILIGDMVVTYDPQTQKESLSKVTWVGKKTAHVKKSRFDDEAGYPVRIVKDAIANNVPNKDLLVTAEHCLFFNGYFVPARMLVNDYSIFYDHSLTVFEYYHIELEKHSVIMADGMLTESYLDTGNRFVFESQKKIVSLKEKNWATDAAAPLMVERSVIEPLYSQIAQRAVEIGCERKQEPVQLTHDADLHLITNTGQVIDDSLVSQDGRIVFIIPAHTKFVRIISRIRRLSNTIGPFVDDRSHVGILIGEIKVSDFEGARMFNIHTEISSLDGWYDKGPDSRWTKGDAFLPLDQLGDFNMPIYLSMKILGGGPYILENKERDQQIYQKQFA